MGLFRDHDFLIRLDPELAHYEECPPSVGEAVPGTQYYKVTDHMHTLPKGLWDTTVSFHAEITTTENGVDWVIRAPMGLLQRSVWSVVPDEESGSSAEEKEGETDGETEGKTKSGEASGLCLIEEIDITCSRLLMGTVRAKCEGNWKGVHGRFVEGLTRPLQDQKAEA